MTTKVYSRKKNVAVRTYKMISPSVGFIFKFATDNVERFIEEYNDYHGNKGYSYQEA